MTNRYNSERGILKAVVKGGPKKSTRDGSAFIDMVANQTSL